MSLTEFELIKACFSDIGMQYCHPGIRQAVGDDCAVLSVPAGFELVMSIDTLVADVHFPADAAPSDIARRALAVAVSDLAAMAAEPLAFTLALTLPAAEDAWLQSFSQGLATAAEHYRIPLIGGDTTRGPLVISIQAQGLLESGSAPLRSGAQVGDDVYVSGCLGDGRLALDLIKGERTLSGEASAYLKRRFYQPSARIKLARALRPWLAAAIDVSDGLLADVGHIASASDVAVRINAADLPLSDTLSSALAVEHAWQYALTGGDDYELCFTARPEHRAAVLAAAEAVAVPVTVIGAVTAGSGVSCVDHAQQPLSLPRHGFQHF